MSAQIKDWLVRYEVTQVSDLGREVDEIVLRVAGTSETAAVQGGQFGLQELSRVDTAEPVEVWRDHEESD